MALDPVTAVAGFGGKVVNLIGEFIEDKDKRNELIFKTQKLTNDLHLEIIRSNTVPWVDALIKLILVMKDFVRPIGGALMTAFGMYCHYKGIEMDTAMQVIFDGALPAWGASRHVEKKNAPNPQTKIDQNFEENGFD